MREILGFAALVATGSALPIWASSVAAFVLTLVLVVPRIRAHHRTHQHRH